MSKLTLLSAKKEKKGFLFEFFPTLLIQVPETTQACKPLPKAVLITLSRCIL